MCFLLILPTLIVSAYPKVFIAIDQQALMKTRSLSCITFVNKIENIAYLSMLFFSRMLAEIQVLFSLALY
jgi:hypothetical protein